MQHTSQYHLFSIPENLLASLTLREQIGQVPPSRSASPVPPPTLSTASAGSRACHVCIVAGFGDVNEQRAHFRSDWHRYNVKIRLNGQGPVTESAFAEMVDQLEDSISGSASSDDDDDSDHSGGAVATLVSKMKSGLRTSSPAPTTIRAPRTPLVWFHCPPSTQIGVYRTLFSDSSETSIYLSELREMQAPAERKWALFMTAGGHFAGAVVRVSNAEDEGKENGNETKRKKPKRPKPDVEVLQHKTFHRYTTRRKQGGSQAANDNAKGNAKSAGATLRRYGEQALREDIQTLMHEWADDISECERIWIRASSSNKKIFLEDAGGVIPRGDARLRTFPFPTRRPTQSELLRCLLELTKVKLSHLTEEALRAQDEAYLASLPKPKPVPPAAPPITEPAKPKPPKLTAEEEVFREKWTRLLEMINKGRLDALVAFWDREGSNLGGIDAPIPEWTREKRRTLLQVATATGNEDILRWILEDAHADPTVDVPVRGIAEIDGEDDAALDIIPPPIAGTRRTAYDLAQTRGARNVFRRCAAAHPDWWDWFGAAKVPSALNQDMEDEQEEKKKVRRKALKDKVREREAKEREKEKEKEQAVAQVTVVEVGKQEKKGLEISGPMRLGGVSGGTESLVGLTPEMRARVERERRARAAEARMKSNS